MRLAVTREPLMSDELAGLDNARNEPKKSSGTKGRPTWRTSL